MVCVPAAAGAAVGTALGAVVARPLLHQVFQGAELATVNVTPTIGSSGVREHGARYTASMVASLLIPRRCGAGCSGAATIDQRGGARRRTEASRCSGG